MGSGTPMLRQAQHEADIGASPLPSLFTIPSLRPDADVEEPRASWPCAVLELFSLTLSLALPHNVLVLFSWMATRFGPVNRRGAPCPKNGRKTRNVEAMTMKCRDRVDRMLRSGPDRAQVYGDLWRGGLADFREFWAADGDKCIQMHTNAYKCIQMHTNHHSAYVIAPTSRGCFTLPLTNVRNAPS